jgi:hypothetical protein
LRPQVVRELCRQYERLDPMHELIPVRPVQHYMMGGVHMDRWAVRVGAYIALMTDVYLPFRRDQGGAEPDSTPAPPDPVDGSGAAVAPEPLPAGRLCPDRPPGGDPVSPAFGKSFRHSR